MQHENKVALAAVLRAQFRGERVLIVVHDFGTTGDFDRVVGDALGVE